jgi:hypothetical protein
MFRLLGLLTALLCVAAAAEDAGAAAMKSAASIEVREQFLIDHPLYFEVTAALIAIGAVLYIMRLMKGDARPAATHDSETPAGESHDPPWDSSQP